MHVLYEFSALVRFLEENGKIKECLKLHTKLNDLSLKPAANHSVIPRNDSVAGTYGKKEKGHQGQVNGRSPTLDSLSPFCKSA